MSGTVLLLILNMLVTRYLHQENLISKKQFFFYVDVFIITAVSVSLSKYNTRLEVKKGLLSD
jgi:hypothetical protein